MIRRKVQNQTLVAMKLMIQAKHMFPLINQLLLKTTKAFKLWILVSLSLIETLYKDFNIYKKTTMANVI